MTAQDSRILKDAQRMLKGASPLLPREELLAFVETYLRRRGEYLHILDAHAPPLYVLETSVLEDRARRFREAFEKILSRVSFYYAVKSNNHPEVSRTLLASGFGLDISSGLELETALSLGAKDIVFSGPGKTDQELRLAVAHSGAVTVLMDSFGELERLEAIAAAANTQVQTGVRVAIDPTGLWRKFGIALDRLPAFWERARHCSHIRLQGLQFHSSWNMSPGPQTDFIKVMGKALKAMPGEFLHTMDFIDIGGGYWPPQGEWLQAAGTPEGALRRALGEEVVSPETHYRFSAAPIEHFAERIGSAVAEHLHALVPCRICLEPGRWICNDAMHLLMSVVDKKAEDLVITDAGTNAVGWERFETDYFPILNLTRPAMEERPCLVLGSLCTPHDIWGYAYWGNDVQPGDILMIPTQGAYTYSLRQHFIKPLPAVITL